MRVLRWVMKRRWVVVVSSALLALYSIGPIGGLILAKAFSPTMTLRSSRSTFGRPKGRAFAKRWSSRMASPRELRQMPYVEHTLMTIGNDAQQTQNRANIYVHLVDPTARPLSQAQMMERVRKEIVAHQPKELRIDVSLSQQINTGQSSAQVQYTISGPDLERLASYATQAVEKLRAFPGAVDVDSNLIVGNPEVHLSVNRDLAANLGVNVLDVANTLQLLVGGLKVSSLYEGGEEYDINARAEREYRDNLASLAMMTVPTASGGSVPLASVVRVTRALGPSQINRLARQRQVTVTANVAPGAGQSTVSDALVKILADLHMPAGYAASPAGFTKETGRAVRGFSHRDPDVPRFHVPRAGRTVRIVAPPRHDHVVLATHGPLRAAVPPDISPGAVHHVGARDHRALWRREEERDPFKWITPSTFARGYAARGGVTILHANRDRLRPILMTTIAFVAGMVPLLFSRGIGAGLNRSIAGGRRRGADFSRSR